jgi:outer membrane lipoprotein SlyB
MNRPIQLMPAMYLVALCALVMVPVLAASGQSAPNAVLGVYVYPKNNQSADKQAADEAKCYASAEQKTGIYPTGNPPSPVPGASHQGTALRGAARGAAAGAAIGAITGGNAGTGAAIGAAAGGVSGHRTQHYANAAAQKQAEAQAQAQHQKNLDAVRRAYTACLDSNNYSVR